MPWFYFHLRSPEGLNRDDIGLEFPSMEAAYLEACHTVPEMSADIVRKKANPARHAFEITDDSGALLIEVPFTEVLDGRYRPVPPKETAQRQVAAATIARSTDLVSEIHAEWAVTRDKLAETRRLLRLMRPGKTPDQ
ncbi:hypothetical protein MKK84_30895 [Methylobacterium sp. E-065]|uniref:DUF6894 family protein n=1 Tax=Methylobacterium sp. E-065 TaxID=2836583 RepID=UPI001FBAD111|nr:hypothetical protein [Methylobacterium sp. E-065]MCJ2021769.1 hypothetical protein [Methylobacterium sp. E-065]